MKKKTKIFFAHSAGAQNGKGKGSYDLAEYLSSTLGEAFDIIFPVVREPERPAYVHWKNLFEDEFQKLKEPVILVGHSLGGSVLLKYLSEAQTNLSIKGIYLVAIPQWDKDGWDVEEFALSANYTAYLPAIPVISFYHCIQDPIVPFEHLDFYRKAFPKAAFHALPGEEHGFTTGLKQLADDICKIS